LLLYYGKYARRRPSVRARLSSHAAWIEELLADCYVLDAPTPAKLRTSVLLVEARAAAYYWGAVAALFPPSWDFPGRRHRGATDPVNMLLNYGYAILFTRVWRAVERHGLHPYVGFLHTSRHQQPGLVLDAMEQFRQPVVDRSVIGLLGRGVRIGIKQDGSLTLRTRRRVQDAIERTSRRPVRGVSGHSLSDEIFRRLGALRRALIEGGRFRGYRMAW
jgi:CRISPR-associated protein Cas1